MSMLQRITVTSLAEQALDKLVGAITSGEFQPGERLSEAELARQLGISRGPLREALGRLEGRLVVRIPRIGVSVVSISREDLIELFAVREALEGMACRVAAERIKPREVKNLAELLARHERDKEVLNGSGYYQRTPDEDFHMQILFYARNSRLEELMGGLYYQLRLYRFRASKQKGRAARAFQEHQEIVKALIARDPVAAEDSMRRHIRNACASMLASLGETEMVRTPGEGTSGAEARQTSSRPKQRAAS